MERHDYDLKQREDKLINVTNESAIVNSFELRLILNIKTKDTVHIALMR